jgi:flagellar basal body-associated protein FliL
MAQQTGGSSGGAIVTLLISLIFFAFVLVLLAASWQIFAKADQPGWAALVPIYNMVVFLKIVGRPLWWLILLFIPFINMLVPLILMHDLSRAFGKGIGFTLGLICLNPIFVLLLAFGPAQYVGSGEPAFSQPFSEGDAPTFGQPFSGAGEPAPTRSYAEPGGAGRLGSPVEIAVAVLAVLLLCALLGVMVSLLGSRGSQTAPGTALQTEEFATDEVAFEVNDTASEDLPDETFIDKGTIDVGSTISGTVASSFELDNWTFEGEAGQPITIYCEPAAGEATDPLVTLLGPDGQSLVEDDDSGGFPNAMIDNFNLPADGIYTISVKILSDGGGGYELLLEEATGEAEIATDRTIEIGSTASGTLADSLATHDWTFEGQAGQTVTIRCDPVAGEDTDPRLTLLGPDGETLAQNDDGGGDYSALIDNFALPTDGVYTIQVDSWFSGGSYHLILE